MVFSSFFPLAASIRNLDSAQKAHIGVFEEISPNLHLDQNPYLTETQQGCNDFCQYDAHRPLYVWYFRARYFSDELGRFISRDPLGYVDGYGLYNGYFASHFWIDPTGMVEPCSTIFVGLTVIEIVNGVLSIVLTYAIYDEFTKDECDRCKSTGQRWELRDVDFSKKGKKKKKKKGDSEHTKNKRPSTKNKHQKGRSRNKRDKKGGEKGDERRPY